MLVLLGVENSINKFKEIELNKIIKIMELMILKKY